MNRKLKILYLTLASDRKTVIYVNADEIAYFYGLKDQKTLITLRSGAQVEVIGRACEIAEKVAPYQQIN